MQSAGGAAGSRVAGNVAVDVAAALNLLRLGTDDAQLAHLLVVAHLGLGELTVFLYQHPDGQKDQSNGYNEHGGYHEFEKHRRVVWDKDMKK